MSSPSATILFFKIHSYCLGMKIILNKPIDPSNIREIFFNITFVVAGGRSIQNVFLVNTDESVLFLALSMLKPVHPGMGLKAQNSIDLI